MERRSATAAMRSSRPKSSRGGGSTRTSATPFAAHVDLRMARSTTRRTSSATSTKHVPAKRRFDSSERASYLTSSRSIPASTAARVTPWSWNSTTWETSHSGSVRSSCSSRGGRSSTRSKNARLSALTVTGGVRRDVVAQYGPSSRRPRTRAGDGDRTRFLQLGRLTCNQLHLARGCARF